MIDEKKLETTPVQYIRNLMNSIKEGKLTITYHDPLEPSKPSYTETYDVSCTAADADEFVSKYESLTSALEAIGKVHDKLDSGANAEDVLTPEQIAVCNTYICGFYEDFDSGEHNVDELFVKLADGYKLSDEEQEVLKRRDEWFEEQCRKRFPNKSDSSKFLVNRAQRYEYFISQNAPKCVIDEEGRRLAEEMILYYAVK